MDKSFEKNRVTEDYDFIKLALTTELSSIVASDRLVLDTISKCNEEIEKQKPIKTKNRLIISRMVKFGAPLTAGALVLLFVFIIPSIFNPNLAPEESMPLCSAQISGKRDGEISPGPFAVPNAAPPAASEIDGGLLGDVPDISAATGPEGSDSLLTPKEGYNIDSYDNMGSCLMQSQQVNEFTVFLRDLFITLDDRGTEDHLISVLTNVLGEPNEESVIVLDESADSHEGVTVRTLEYDGLIVTISGVTTYSISTIEIINEKYTTYRGITIGMSIEDLKSKYENISLSCDGRTDHNNCAYLIEDNCYFIRFEEVEGIITNIKYYTELE